MDASKILTPKYQRHKLCYAQSFKEICRSVVIYNQKMHEKFPSYNNKICDLVSHLIFLLICGPENKNKN